jgi:hypothetical protein
MAKISKEQKTLLDELVAGLEQVKIGKTKKWI